MAKKSQRRRSRNKRDQSGCISGLISMFDFRQGRSTRKLLADDRRVSKQVQVSRGQSNIQTIISLDAENYDTVEDADGNMEHVSDIAKTSVKKLMEEEMINEQGFTSLSQKINSKQRNFSKKNSKRIKNRSLDMTIGTNISELDDEHGQTHSNVHHLVKLMEELAQVDLNGLNTPCYNDVPIVQDNLIAAVKRFLEQNMSKSKHFGEESSEFMDAMEMLGSNKGLLLKLLQDPNSTLVRHVENFEEAQLGKDRVPNPLSGSSLQEQSTKLKSGESFKHHNIFRRRRSKSLGNYPLELVKDDSPSPSRMVVLKPGAAESDGSEVGTSANNKVSARLSDVDSKVLITKHASQFSFTEIKRRLRHAMGRDLSPGTSPGKTVSSGQKSANHAERANLGWRSPNRNHFYTERFTLSSPMSSKRHAQVGTSKGKGFVSENETSQYPTPGGSSIYVEDTKHLAEMLENGDESGEFVDVQLPKPLGTILSLPSYNSSPCPRNQVEGVSVNAQTRLGQHDVLKNSVSSNVHENVVSCSSPSREDVESKQRMAGGNDEQDCSLEALSAEAITIHEVAAEIEDTTEARTREDESSVSISRESSNHSIADDLCLKSDISEGDEYLSSPTTSPQYDSLRDVEDSEYAVEKSDRPSPISILEPLFTDDETSPQSIMPSPGIEPIHIHFEERYPPIDQAICNRISPEDEESAFEYLEAVLLGSGLDWDEFSVRWLSHHEILDPSLFDEVELFSSRSRHDQKLLFDCANEALEEICQVYFRRFEGTPCLKHTNQQVPRGMNLISDVWDRVEKLLTSNPQHLSLDQHIRRDLAGSRKWMELRSDVELIGNETEEVIFDELVEDIALSFKDDDSSPFEKSDL